jgi:endonuclease-3
MARGPAARPKTAEERKKRVSLILRRLNQAYPNVECALTHSSAWELLAATILSAQCTDKRVNMVTPELFAKYPTVRDMAVANQADVEQVVKTTGFFRNKAKSLIGAAKGIVGRFGGEVPSNMDDMLTLPGAARKTANVVLGTWFKKATGVVVDTHVHRISKRLDLTQADEPKKIEQDLMKAIPKTRWILFSHQIIWHGREVCLARRPRCAACNLYDLCYSSDKTA